MKKIRIGLLGLGSVGGGVYQILRRKKALLERRAGARLELVSIAVRNPRKKRGFTVPKGLLAKGAFAVANDPRVDCVLELIGGTGLAKKVVLEALRNGKDVITANKALLAEHGCEIFKTARKHGGKVFFEASVAGGVPVIRALQLGLSANEIKSIFGIINGTSNYILTRMSDDGVDFKSALATAQKAGYAEADPSLDIDGVDAAHKLAILASLAFEEPFHLREISCEGIRAVEQHDINFAKQFGYVIKLLAVAKKTPTGIEARVQPTLLPKEHILAQVKGALSAVSFRGDETGDVLLCGRGAGAHPTASAVISDLIALARGENSENSPWLMRKKSRTKATSRITSRYYLRFSVTDKPGSLSKISGILGQNGVSISDVIQMESKTGNAVPLIMLTHQAREEDISRALRRIRKLPLVLAQPHVLRIES